MLMHRKKLNNQISSSLYIETSNFIFDDKIICNSIQKKNDNLSVFLIPHLKKEEVLKRNHFRGLALKKKLKKPTSLFLNEIREFFFSHIFFQSYFFFKFVFCF